MSISIVVGGKLWGLFSCHHMSPKLHGAALMAFLGAELKSGIEIVTTALNLEEHIHDCTLVITGEGRIDSQSIHGKVPIGVANVAKKYHKPVIGIAGSLTN
ncbi:glycerate kinase, partial [Pseudomonas aeruginosa]|uniref:GAF domain-containing protein n=1 Tax=Pseudomonas aeruginosa TaxID=287 RepID=UPI0031B68D07